MKLTKKSNIDKLSINQFKSYKKIARDRSRGIINYNEFREKLDLLLIKWNLENERWLIIYAWFYIYKCLFYGYLVLYYMLYLEGFISLYGK